MSKQNFALFHQGFDKDDPSNIGRPNYFNVEQCLSCVEQFITCDEVETAMYILDHLPGYYRDNYPREAKMIKEQLLKRFFTTLDYAKDGLDGTGVDVEQRKLYMLQPHGQVVLEKCKKLNELGFIPHITELGPGNYWLAHGLKENGINFTYYGPSLNGPFESMSRAALSDIWQDRPDPGQKQIFVCFEMLEHLADTSDIYHFYVRNEVDADFLFLSTPLYAFGGGIGNWYESDLGHRRTYTPNEFHQFCLKHWPQFKFVLYRSHVMCLAGEK